MPPGADIAANLVLVRRSIRVSAERAGRRAGDVTLVAVSKTFEAELVREAALAGQRDFGENRVQEGLDKAGRLEDLTIEWHLIGHLQSNKARKAAGTFAWIHSVDRLDLIARLNDGAADAGKRPRVLIQVDLAHETTKFGADVPLVRELAEAALASPALELRGLMIIPPVPDAPEASRPWFRRLRELRDELVLGGIPAAAMAHLSMGMSQDFEVAIEEGATIVRVGTAIFGRRPPPAR